MPIPMCFTSTISGGQLQKHSNPEDYEKSQNLAQEQEPTESFLKKRKLAVSTASTIASPIASSITMYSSKSIYSTIQEEQQQGTKKHKKHVNDDSLDPISSTWIIYQIQLMQEQGAHYIDG